MNVLVVGKGGREHALVWKLAQSPRIDNLYVAPGNPGMADLAECIDIRVDTPVSEREKLTSEIERLIVFAKERQIALTVVGPDDALAGGIVDRFRAENLRIFGPTSPPVARLISARSRPTTTRRRRCASISSAPSAPASRRSSSYAS